MKQLSNIKQLVTAGIVGAITALIFMAVFSFSIQEPIGDWFEPLRLILVEQPNYRLSETENTTLQNLINAGVITEHNRYINDVTNFYSFLIQTLIGIFVIFSIVTAYVVRSNSIQAAENLVDKKVADHFDSKYFSAELTSVVDSIVQNIFPDNVPEKLASIEADLAQIAKKIAEKQDDGEVE